MYEIQHSAFLPFHRTWIVVKHGTVYLGSIQVNRITRILQMFCTREGGVCLCWYIVNWTLVRRFGQISRLELSQWIQFRSQVKNRNITIACMAEYSIIRYTMHTPSRTTLKSGYFKGGRGEGRGGLNQIILIHMESKEV